MKEFYHSKKKKIRGWKRHKRKIERWKQHVINLDMDYIRENQRDYEKLWIHPFYSLVRTTPPNWYNQLLLSEMIDVYLNWHEKMAKENEDFFLKIWLYEPDFISSQIVVSYKDCINLYDDTFDKHTITKAFPFHKYESLKNKLALFEWEAHINADQYLKEDLKENIELGFSTEDEVNEIINKAYKTEKINLNYENDVLYKVNVGDVWVGTLKK
ncbi:hypothetical protein COL32_00720 [Bacillus pseudomycoides]|uniref:hypothetical protein n=1 Tax=Bacillus pseudomycoides TaxID=64104 RepID=UPI000BF41AE9|nr:hypothetical protein [Bacillus pseudomycoides]PFW90112.1 hypothetical protein COL29_21770 [Bacillus pseudomycoides]PFX47898.1 hypothetical protein COL32_00720 [Bacillus pseudomycoides]